MKNKLSDLRDHLFLALENLVDADGEDLDKAVRKADAVSNVAKVIVDTARVEIDYIRHVGGKVESSVFIESKPALPPVEAQGGRRG
ncbi:hypothetical protein [Pseudomonas syringae group genomosp. 3]|uniref:Uncharacterized protein n=2 Tax=Pseudomonas syringae group genomosp. 3 TaxID=251701 RepID=Q87Y62_PSESM|nr:hypothetical protein [Pseudomonas syringae group genomosp. 3]AAO57408.1 hypothetical protein PSPTO_3947 [Pseudomonas syringae pv. tomato str. DC3000]KKI26534.1 hypothetical protein WX98_08810 [Pseudomonas syringae pv. persicae]KPB89479.1 Uncharacterized protein AC502_3863 [Pseudomonas syringae pv. maculicola]KPY93465.1 Uncharacterized protein ALO36_00448 [Pseudomonas syringae pv. tomato]TES74078.1 hypothetical protein E2N89_25130 [Pseudomonas syringae pv. tomato]